MTQEKKSYLFTGISQEKKRANKHVKRQAISVVVKKMQINVPRKYHQHLEDFKIKNSNVENNNNLQVNV